MSEKTKQIIKSNLVKVLGTIVAAFLLMVASPMAAEAARSGGRAGGSGFSSARSYSAPTRSYAPSSRSYAPQPMQRTNTIIAPSFGFGYGFGYPAPVVYAGGGGGGGGIFTLILIGIFAFVIFNSFAGQADEDEYEDDVGNEPMSVVKLQVGLLGSARELQRDLNRLANNLDTSTPSGLHYLLTETVLALRRNPQYAVYGKSELEKTRGLDNAESKFNQASMTERGKFQRETLSNVGGRTSRSVANVTGDGANELIVVTVIAAVDGKLEPGPLSDQEGLKSNLELLGAVPAERLLALEVLWTPQDENDFFTKDELAVDYPTLNML